MEWWRADSSNQAEEGEVETSWLPPGFRFHPTDEELLTYYLRNKVQNVNFIDLAISEVDFNKVEPWDLPGRAKIGEKEWYFFSLRDRKYPTGMRTNRATDAGYWKATGKDREITCSRTFRILGMKKTLVFYKGRAPKGVKTNWVIHEYRLEGSNFRDSEHPALWRKDEWVVCRVFKKSVPTPSIDFKSVSTTSLEVKYGQPYYEILSDIDSSLPALESPQMHMQHPPCSSPQQETPLFHNCSYNDNGSSANESIGSRNRDNKALISSSFGNIASTAVPFCCLQQEAAGFNYYKAHPSPCLFPSSSPNEPRKQQYNDYSTIDCKITLPHQSFSHSELPATRSNMFARNTCTYIEALWTGTMNATPYNEADAISVDLMPTTL